MKNTLFFIVLLLLAACHPAKKCEERPKTDCICTKQYDPVCGCNGKTYGNACMAACAGIGTFSKGACAFNIEKYTWRVKSMGTIAQQLTVPDSVHLYIRMEGGKLSGNGGCNAIGGNYTLEGDKLAFSGIFSTKKYCADAAKLEDVFLQHLQTCQSYSMNHGFLALDCGATGVVVLGVE